MAETSSEIERSKQLRSAETFEQAVALAGGMDQVTHIGELVGDGFSLLEEKERLVGTPLLVVDYRLNEKLNNPDRIADFYSVYIVTNDNHKYVLNDGGSGIARQLDEVDEIGKEKALPLYVGNGLRVSRYTYENEQGDKIPASTWYFDTSR